MERALSYSWYQASFDDDLHVNWIQNYKQNIESLNDNVHESQSWDENETCKLIK